MTWLRPKSNRRSALVLAVCAALLGALAVGQPDAVAKGVGTEASRGGISVDGQPYRYVAITLPAAGAAPRTLVERIDLRDGKVARWWCLPGHLSVAAVTYDGTPGGLSADGRTLVLSDFTGFPPRGTSFGVLDTEGGLRRLHLRGQYMLHAVSPSGSRVYLVHYLIAHGPVVPPGHGTDDLEIRELDPASGELASRPVPVSSDRSGQPLSGIAISNATSPNGRWTYTLFYGDRHQLFLLALDTVTGRAVRTDLPRLRGGGSSEYGVRLRRGEGGRELEVLSPWTFARRPLDLAHVHPLLRIDTHTFAFRGRATASRRQGELGAIAEDARHRFPMSWNGIAGRSAEGRPIRIDELGESALKGELLIFGCIHGDECAARDLRPTTGGCPPPGADIYVVPNLDPDGAAVDSRLNGRGVDLNRNFPSGWRPIGERWDPQYSGPRPLSEPETRLAARIVRTLEPATTIWFHQHGGARPYVRAWGQSVPVAAEFARRARMPFKLLPWPAGTAPNWQNHRFPGTSSFVVELPSGELGAVLESRLSTALVWLGRQVRDD